MEKQQVIPFGGMNVDIEPSYLSDAQAFFIKNLTYDINANGSTNPELPEGMNAGDFTPLESNTKYCNLTLPDGKNFCVGFYESKEMAEGYVFGWNSEDNHFIYRISGRTGGCQMVYKNSCLNFQLRPRYFIAEGRCVLETTAFVDKFTDTEQIRKYLIFTDDFNPQRFISVEDSIVTNSFNGTDFPYFNTTDPECEKCNWINLGVPTPMGCIGITQIQRDPTDEVDKNKPNQINYKGWQFRIRNTDHWGRDSEHGVISDLTFNVTGAGCIADSNGLARCWTLKFKAGCPFNEKIQVEFRNCNGNVRGLSIASDWYLYDVIDKYNTCENVVWYARTINNPWQKKYDERILAGDSPEEATKAAKGLLKYNPGDNTFEYTFCADREYSPIAVEETNRSQNPLPNTSGSVFSLSKNIGLARNRRGFEPVDCNQFDKISFAVTPPDPTSNCINGKLRKITFYAVIWNPFDDTAVPLRIDSGTPIFATADCAKNNAFTYKQTLPKDQEGIIAYLAGTKTYCIGKQQRYERATGIMEYVGLAYSVPGGILNAFKYLPVQKYEMEVLPGKYIIRFSGHRSSPTDDYQKTSTYLIGTTTLPNPGGVTTEVQELVIDVCTDDITLANPFMIYDLTRTGKGGCALTEATNVVEGYIREDEINRLPIELARIDPSINNTALKFTDHNGHYWAVSRGRGLYVDLHGFKNCIADTFLAKSDTSYDNYETWYRYNDLYAYKGTNPYLAKDRFLVKGKIVLCGSPTIGVAGSLVILTRGQYAYTDNNGEFSIVAHDIGNAAGRADILLYSQRGICQMLTCDAGCNFCFPNVAVVAPACATGRIVTVADVTVRINGLNKRGPQMGGRYSLGFKCHDWLGRHDFVQSSDKYYIDIPTLQDTQVFDFSTISFAIQNTIVFPAWVKYLSFYITENLAYDDFLTWVAERVQFVDNTGNVNTAAPTQIRLYYQSLNEYNKQNDYSTNAIWQFLISNTTNPILGDQIEFLANDGAIFTKRITALAQYDKEGKYVAVPYSDELKDLKDGALIKLIRPKENTDSFFYYELCPIIRVADGVPVILNGTFNFFDAYMQNRQIPVPVEKSTTNPTTGEIVTTTENQLRSYPYLFEHHSPSDKWGDHCYNKGRVNTKNPYENQQLIRTEVALSAALSNNGVINGLHYFTDANVHVFDEQLWAGIVAVMVELNTLLIICEHDSFVVTYDDTQIKVASDGRVYANTLENQFGRPERKIGNNFGCDMEDINTIRRRDGLVMFLDRGRTGIIVHNYEEGTDIASAGLKSWIKTKLKHIQQYNATHDDSIKYFHSCMDPKRGEYLLTSFNLNFDDFYNVDADYVNNERQIMIDANETAAFDIVAKRFKTWYSFTPEYFGTLEGDNKDNQLFSIRHGEAWYHTNLITPGASRNVFFDVPCDWVMEVVANLGNDEKTQTVKVKRFLTIQVHVKQVRLYADKITTQSGQLSRLMPDWWERRDKYWVADIKCDLNTPADTNMPLETGANALLDGNLLFGTWMKVRIVPHPDDRQKYMQLRAIIFSMLFNENN